MGDTTTDDAHAPGYEVGSQNTSRKRRIQGDGRGQPCTQQGMIVQSVRFPRGEFLDRKAKMQYNNVYAPLGDESCMQAMQGEVAFSAVDDFGVVERSPNAFDSQMDCHTSVNGWNKDVDAMFAGVVRNARPLSQSDDSGTVARCGTQTIINTGPDDTMCGDIIYFSMHPYTTTTESGQIVPAVEIEEPGTPGYHGQLNAAGELCPKFRVATYAIRDNSMYTFLRKADIIAGRFTLDDMPAGSDLSTLIQELIHKTSVPYRQHAPEMPAMKYATFAALQKFFTVLLVYVAKVRDVTKLNLTNVKDVWNFINELEKLEYFKQYFDGNSKRRMKFNEAIGLANANESDVWRPSETLKEEHDLAQGIESSGGGGDSSVKLSGAAMYFVSLCENMLQLCTQAKLELDEEQHNFLRKRVIGKCLKGAAPGSGMDVALGYGHA